MADISNWRGWVNKNPRPAMTAAVIIIVGAFVFLLYPRSSQRRIAAEAYFYDLGTRKLFTAKIAPLPPIDTEAGKDMGVVALVYGCGDCAESHRFIAYLQRYNAVAKQRQLENWEEQKKLGATALLPLPNLKDGLEVRGVDGGPWNPFSSAAGRALTNPEEIAKHCPGSKLVVCNPGE